MRIVLMGTPDFAVPTLDTLYRSSHNIVGVVTAPDKPKGRGQKLATSPVKDYAQTKGLNLLQPPNLKDPEFQAELKALRADVFVVVAFRMLPESVWSLPPKGTFNLHASLLPDYRGAAPINWAIINGEEETGLTTFFIEKEIDKGQILFQEKEPIYREDTAGTLHDRLKERGAGLVLRTVDALEKGEHQPKPQPECDVNWNPAPKVYTESCNLSFTQKTESLYNFIRGLSPHPGARCQLNGKSCKLLFAEPHYGESSVKGKPGEIDSDQKSYFHIGTVDGYLAIKRLQQAGKRPMEIEEFLRGTPIVECC